MAQTQAGRHNLAANERNRADLTASMLGANTNAFIVCGHALARRQ
jgi:hypothetical protein